MKNKLLKRSRTVEAAMTIQLPHFKMTLDIPYSNISTGRAIRLTLLNNNQVDNNGNRQYVTKYSTVKGFSQFSVSIIRSLDVWHEMGNFSGKISESTQKYIICLSFSNYLFFTQIFLWEHNVLHMYVFTRWTNIPRVAYTDDRTTPGGETAVLCL